MVFGFEIQTIYLTTLVIAGSITIVYVLFSDFLDGIFEGLPFIDIGVILSFFTIVSASGFLLEKFTAWSVLVNLIIACILSAASTAILYFFLLIPLRSAEVSLAYTEESLGGQVGRVIVPIPTDGFGEVVIETGNGLISKRATGFENEEIGYDEEVLIIEAKDGTVYVRKYASIQFNLN